MRHASAGETDAASGERCLDHRGLRQAEAVAAAAPDLGMSTVAGVAASPALRCRQTAQPVAALSRHDVVIAPWLGEGSRLLAVLDGIAAHDGWVLCSHADVIGAVVERLVQTGVIAPAQAACQLASIWRVELVAGRVTAAAYHAPTA